MQELHEVDRDEQPEGQGTLDPQARYYDIEELGVSCIDVIESLGLSFHHGNAMKYLWRAGRKPGADHIRDLQKAAWYIQRAISQATKQEMIEWLQKEEPSPPPPATPNSKVQEIIQRVKGMF